MKKAAKVFIIIGIVCSGIILLCGLISYESLGAGYLLYGVYCLVTSIGSLVAVNKKSKTAIVIWGVFYIPVVALASVFMFCIKKEDLIGLPEDNTEVTENTEDVFEGEFDNNSEDNSGDNQ